LPCLSGGTGKLGNAKQSSRGNGGHSVLNGRHSQPVHALAGDERHWLLMDGFGVLVGRLAVVFEPCNRESDSWHATALVETGDTRREE